MVNEVDYPGSNPGPIIFHLSLVLNIIAYDKNVSKESPYGSWFSRHTLAKPDRTHMV